MSIVVNDRVRRFISKTIGEHINSPQQRLIQGATALAIQPYIDFHNKKADKDTRAVSVARTIGKIVAGTIVGVGVRALCIRVTKNFSLYKLTTVKKIVNNVEKEFVTEIKAKRKRDIFTPIFAKIKKDTTPEEFAVRYNRYVKAMGTITATVAMVFTNFLIDAPLTRLITKLLTPSVKSYIDKNEPEVQNAESS